MRELGLSCGTARPAVLHENGRQMANTSSNIQDPLPEEEVEVSEMDHILEKIKIESQRLQRSRKFYRKKPVEPNIDIFHECGPRVLGMIKKAVHEEEVVSKPVKKKKKTPSLPSILPKTTTSFASAPKKTKQKMIIRNHYDLPHNEPSSPDLRLFREVDENGKEVVEVDGLVDIEDSGFYMKNSLRYGSLDGRVNDTFHITDRQRLDFLQMKLLLEKRKREEQLRLQEEKKKKISKKIQKVLAPLPTPPQKADLPRKAKSCRYARKVSPHAKRVNTKVKIQNVAAPLPTPPQKADLPRKAKSCRYARNVSPPAKRVNTKAVTRASKRLKVVDAPNLKPMTKDSTKDAKIEKLDVPVPVPKRAKAVTRPTKRLSQHDIPTSEPKRARATTVRTRKSVVSTQEPKKIQEPPAFTKPFNPDMPVLRSRTRASLRAAAKPMHVEIPRLEPIVDFEPLTPVGHEEAMPVLLNMDEEEIDQPMTVVKNKLNSMAGHRFISDTPVFPSPGTAKGGPIPYSSKVAVLKPIKICRKPPAKEGERSSLLLGDMLLIRKSVTENSSKKEIINEMAKNCSGEAVNVSKGVVFNAGKVTKNDKDNVRSGFSNLDVSMGLPDVDFPSREKNRDHERSRGSPDTISSGSWRSMAGEEANGVGRFDPAADIMNDPNVGEGSSSGDEGFYVFSDDEDSSPIKTNRGEERSRQSSPDTVSSEGWREISGEEAGTSADTSLDNIFAVKKEDPKEVYDFYDDDHDYTRLTAEKGSSVGKDLADIERVDHLPPTRLWNHPSWENTPSTSFSVKSDSSATSSTDSSTTSSTDSANSSVALTTPRCNDDSSETSSVGTAPWKGGSITRSRICPLRRRYNSSDEEIYPFYDKSFSSPSDPLIPSPIASQQ